MAKESNSKRSSKKKKRKKSKSSSNSSSTSSNSGATHHEFIHEFGRKLFLTLVGILVAYLIVYVGTLVRNNLKEYRYIGQAEQSRSISVNASGEVRAKPDMATVNFGMETTASTTKAAQEENNQTINELTKQLKEMGIKEENIKTTNYSSRPDYEYNRGEDKKREKIGQIVSQNIEVELMDTDMTGKVIDLAGKLGINDIRGVDYEIKDPEKLKQKARQKAIKKAKKKAWKLSRQLGVRLGDVVNFSENSSDRVRPMYEKAMADFGSGGDTSTKIETGQQTVTVDVNLRYSIR
jgi:uncharacterized protein YggE